MALAPSCRTAARKTDPFNTWVNQLHQRRGYNRAGRGRQQNADNLGRASEVASVTTRLAEGPHSCETMEKWWHRSDQARQRSLTFIRGKEAYQL